MKNREITWTLATTAGGEKSASYQTLGTFPTKRLAVQAMESIRAPKTRVTRVGHTFVFQPR